MNHLWAPGVNLKRRKATQTFLPQRRELDSRAVTWRVYVLLGGDIMEQLVGFFFFFVKEDEKKKWRG